MRSAILGLLGIQGARAAKRWLTRRLSRSAPSAIQDHGTRRFRELFPEAIAWSETAPAARFPLAPPHIFNAVAGDASVLRWMYAEFAAVEATAEAQGYITLRSHFVYDGQYILGKDNNWLAPTTDEYQHRDIVLPIVLKAIASKFYHRLHKTGSYYVVIGRSGANNYGHFLVDVAPKLINLARAKLGRVTILWQQDAIQFAPVIMDICRHLGILADVMIVRKGGLIALDEVMYFTAVSHISQRGSPTLLALRDVLLSLYGAAGKPEKSLLIERGPFEHRRLINQPEVISTFADRGFQSLFPAAISFPDQVRLFAQARRLVGSHGAGLTNGLFAHRDCDVLMISPGYPDLFFWNLACLSRQRFYWHFARNVVGWNDHDTHADYDVDLDELKVNLDQIGWT